MEVTDWLAAGTWCLVAAGIAYGFRTRRLAGHRSPLIGTLASVVGLAYVAFGFMLMSTVPHTMVYDYPRRDLELRLLVFVSAATTLLAGASSLHSGVALLRKHPPRQG